MNLFPRLLLLTLVTGPVFTAGMKAAELTVSAASSLTESFKTLTPLFEKQNPGTKVKVNFAASGALLKQIENGAPVDVFASADEQTMDKAAALGLIDTTGRRNFVSNTLVLIVPAPGKTPPKTLADLAGPAYKRIAIGLPASVPAGHYTRAALEKSGHWSAVEPKMIGAQNVRQALDYVSRGEVDAGFVYATDAAIMTGKVTVAFTVPTPAPILYPVAPVKTSAQPELARKFTAYLITAEAQAVLGKHGFAKP